MGEGRPTADTIHILWYAFIWLVGMKACGYTEPHWMQRSLHVSFDQPVVDLSSCQSESIRSRRFIWKLMELMNLRASQFSDIMPAFVLSIHYSTENQVGLLLLFPIIHHTDEAMGRNSNSEMMCPRFPEPFPLEHPIPSLKEALEKVRDVCHAQA